jgi:hypothetical protein
MNYNLRRLPQALGTTAHILEPLKNFAEDIGRQAGILPPPLRADTAPATSYDVQHMERRLAGVEERIAAGMGAQVPSAAPGPTAQTQAPRKRKPKGPPEGQMTFDLGTPEPPPLPTSRMEAFKRHGKAAGIAFLTGLAGMNQ